VKRLLTPVISFLLLYSFLPHKELRFVWYTIPLINVVAAVGLNRILNNKTKSFGNRMAYLLALLGLLGSMLATWFLLGISSMNYPGGFALQKLHSLEGPASTAHVHIDVAAAMTGVSRFGERMSDQWRYSKEESLKDFSKFTHLLSENATVTGFEVIGSIKGYNGLNLRWKDFPNFINFADKIYILKKRN